MEINYAKAPNVAIFLEKHTQEGAFGISAIFVETFHDLWRLSITSFIVQKPTKRASQVVGVTYFWLSIKAQFHAISSCCYLIYY